MFREVEQERRGSNDKEARDWDLNFHSFQTEQLPVHLLHILYTLFTLESIKVRIPQLKRKIYTKHENQ